MASARYFVQSPDERWATPHRKIARAAERINWLLNRGHSDIDLCFTSDEGIDRHILVNEFIGAAELEIRIRTRAEECGLRFTIGGRY